MMPTLPELTATLDALGVRLSLRLRVDAPRGVLTPELTAALAAHKPTLVARLAGVEVEPSPARGLPWDVLQHLRWGPGLTGLSPSIDFDGRHDPLALAGRLAAAGAHLDAYAVAEREAIQVEARPP